MLGYVTMTTTCEGLAVQAETKVEAASPYRLLILAQDSDVPTEYGVMATMQFLDGGRTLGRFSSACFLFSTSPTLAFRV